MADQIDDQYEVFKMLLDSTTPADAVKQLSILGVGEATIQQIVERHEQQMIRIREMDEPRSVVMDNRDTWYAGPRPGDKCWPAVVDILHAQGWEAVPSISDLNDCSTRIVSLLSHPKEKSFSTRGLVVGYVQSGKTTNFTAVMAKAADRGYKLFIVLAGIHNGLRRQTQARLIQQLVEPNPSRWTQITDLDRDFRPTANPASFFGKANKTHVLCVVKKNAPVLRKLTKWLENASGYLIDCPALIIDDEADQATVATKSINPLIRQILDRLPKSAYVGYTASPFANLLIDPSVKDLYPEHFIVSLPKPSGHFGTEVLFGRYALDGEDPSEVDDGFDMIRIIPDKDVEFVRPKTKADVDGFAPELTQTLTSALQYFWMTTAARRVRGSGNPHSTMLIHTSVRTSVHNSFRGPLENFRSELAMNLYDPNIRDDLKFLWDSETKRVLAEDFRESPVSFDQLLLELPGVLADSRVVMDNSESIDRLDYENGPVVAVVVGGNTLSRGLTLEGLSVSYFVRAVSAYDTLLQMGRWFGYRNGYADLPRIWMTAEIEDWFRHLATVETEMRRDIDIYLTENKSPREFAVRIRTHPALRVTAAAKMKDAVVAASAYGGLRIQTHYFHTKSDWLLANQRATSQLVVDALRSGQRTEAHPNKGRYIFHNVASDFVLRFLRDYQFHERSLECDSKLIVDYIEKRIRVAGSLRQWNVAIVGRPVGDPDENFEFTEGVAVRRISRARMRTSEANFADIKTLMSRRDAVVDINDADVEDWEEKKIVAERAKRLPNTGLVVLYPIDKASRPSKGREEFRLALDAEEHVIGVGLVFPRPGERDSEVEGEVKYISADLSGVEREEEDYSVLEAEDSE
ncbi:Z1 domain-containing protein [Nocardia sp. XZ_19_369]|uniref:Z1 domain-containing protein n=1 Tax=Nocardia sp. XZ_19_369 TaxID=2769487 RepID=UPI00188E5BFC|nr:Z1 domain-containing protein [Nocardia sp. XZ_19_369]